ncbi:hypothetical protein [Desulfuribacillus alkaliarsenatis]|uniref:Uncharacterized protein n=1 Tax=Desulfuribacillus alkaliarsenatis TaxID=766136 RepID=A0A1E5G6D4_9FIRM|nr:hypothetical protein [Desulfuribacillus alkaliarsenatis]OEF98731.1 hypothetical protein BHF68_03470 [Desulfuribacillus alkaliarsenatis]
MILLIMSFILAISYSLVYLITFLLENFITDIIRLQINYDLLAIFYSFFSLIIIFMGGIYSSMIYNKTKEKIVINIAFIVVMFLGQIIGLLDKITHGLVLLTGAYAVILPQVLYYLFIIICFIIGQLCSFDLGKQKKNLRAKMFKYSN